MSKDLLNFWCSRDPTHRNHDQEYTRNWRADDDGRKQRNNQKRKAALAHARREARSRGFNNVNSRIPSPDPPDDNEDELYPKQADGALDDDEDDCWDPEDDIPDDVKEAYDQAHPKDEQYQCKPCASKKRTNICSFKTSRFPCERCKELKLMYLRALKKITTNQTQPTLETQDYYLY